MFVLQMKDNNTDTSQEV